MKHHDYSHPVDTTPVKVCAVVVYHREENHPWLAEALESLQVQSYPNLECIQVDNHANAQSIGSARNQAVQATDADLVLILAEEDLLTPDALQAMVDLFLLARQSAPNVAHINTGTIAIDKEGQPKGICNLRAPGMYTRQFLIENPFDDAPNPDQSMQRRMETLAKEKGAPLTTACTHHFGYLMRMHPFRRDGIALQ